MVAQNKNIQIDNMRVIIIIDGIFNGHFQILPPLFTPLSLFPFPPFHPSLPYHSQKLVVYLNEGADLPPERDRVYFNIHTLGLFHPAFRVGVSRNCLPLKQKNTAAGSWQNLDLFRRLLKSTCTPASLNFPRTGRKGLWAVYFYSCD